MNDRPETRTVTLTRVFDAPIELVYEAWTKAEHVQKWMKCDADVATTLEGWVPKVGAEFSTHMLNPGKFDVRSTGTFLEVDPPHVLAYENHAHAEMGMPAMTVRIELAEVDGGTQLTLTHSGLPNEMICGIVEGGWTVSLDLLKDLMVALAGAYASVRMGNRGSGDRAEDDGEATDA